MANKKYEKYPNDPLSAEELKALSEPPRGSLDRLREGKGSATDWYNVALRTVFGCRVAEKVFTAETANEFHKCWDLLEVIQQRHKTNFEEDWSVLHSEYLTLKRGLDGVDEICEVTDRHSMIYAIHRAKSRLSHFVRRYTKAEKEYDAKQAAEGKQP